MAWHPEETIGLEMIVRGLLQELGDRLACKRVGAKMKIEGGGETCADLLVTSAALGSSAMKTTKAAKPCAPCRALYHGRLTLGALERIRSEHAEESIDHAKGKRRSKPRSEAS